MLPITKQERAVVISLAAILLVGMTLQGLLKFQPSLNQFFQFAERREFGLKIDLNTATGEQLEQLPYIGKITARKILDYRKMHGPFKTLEDLKNVQGVGSSVYERVVPLLRL